MPIFFSFVGDLTDMRWTRWSRRCARRVSPDPALSFADPSRKRWRQSRGRWDSTPSNCSRLAQRGWGSPPPPPWTQQNTFTLQGTSRIQGNTGTRVFEVESKFETKNLIRIPRSIYFKVQVHWMATSRFNGLYRFSPLFGGDGQSALSRYITVTNMQINAK